MGGKSSTTSQTVEIPPEVREQYKQVIARANQITQRPFQTYSSDPTAFVAPLTATQQAGIANINAIQGMAQPSVEQGQGMITRGIEAGVPLQYQSLGTAAEGRGAGSRLFGESLGTAEEGRGLGSRLYGESLGTAATGTGQAESIYRRVLPEIQRAAEVGEAASVRAQPFIEGGLGAASPYMSRAGDYTTAGLGAGAGMGLLSADYLSRGTQNVSPTEFSGEQIDRYMSPYMKNVVAAQQALQAEEAAQQRSALRGQQIAAGAFGGDRGGIAQANLARQQSLANQATLSNLLQGGYGQALGAFQQQQGTRLAAEQANRAAQQFGSQQAAALGQQMFGQNLAAGSQLANIGQALFGQNITQGQALAALGQQLYAQRMGGAQAAAGIGTNLAAMKAQEAALQQQAAQGVFGQAAQQAALQQQAAQGVFNQAAQEAALQQAASQNVYNMAAQGGMNYANLGLAGQAAALQAAQAQLGAGQIEQQTEQAAKSAMYNQFLQQQGYPYQQVGFLGNVSMGIGSQSGGTTTTQQGSYSDRRLKEDIRKVGETFDGQPIYSFKYKGEDKSQLGLMAQEVEKSHPEAVGERNGYLTVDYQDATEDAAKRGHFASGGLVPSRMGGAVTAPGDYARGGYAEGGDAEYAPGAAQVGAQAQSDGQAAASALNPEVRDIYQKYLFRDQTPDENTYWQNRISQGTPLTDIDTGIANTRERQMVNQAPLTYNPANFGTGAAPVQNRYGFYSAPTSSIGSSFTPQAIAARQNAAAPAATGKGASSSSYLPSSGPRYGATTPVATGKGASAAPSVGMGSYATPPVATGKGASTGSYGAPAASGKGPATRGYASGGRIGYSRGGAGANDLRDYIDMMSGSPKGLAMAHSGIFQIPGERADITKYTEGMSRSRGSNVPQPGRIPEQRNILKEAAETGTNIAKIAELGSKARDKFQQFMARPAAGTTTTTTAPAGEAPQPARTAAAPTSGPQVAASPAATPTQMAGDITPLAETVPDVPFDTASLDDLGSLFAANGGRIQKAMAGAVGSDDDGTTDPSEGAYAPVGAGLDIEFQPPSGSSFVKDATQRLLKGGSGGGGGGGQSTLGGIAQAAQIGMTAFKVGQTIAAFLPMIFSDERLKKNAKPIGRLYDGQTVYRFDMDGETKIGLMAQEVEKKVPDAVGLAGKYKAVDYELATAKAAKRGHFAVGGASSDITEDPVAETIREARVAPSEAMTIADATPREERAPAPAPVQTAGLSPTAPTGVQPAATPSRGEEMFARVAKRTGEGSISQISPAAARDAAASLGIDFDPDRLRSDPDYNMKLGKAYFNMQMDRFGGDPMIASAAYTAGPDRVARAIETAKEKGGDFLDYLPPPALRYLAEVSDAAQGAHQRLLERQKQVEAKAAQGTGPAVVDAPRPDGLAGAVAQAPESGKGAPTGVAPPSAAPAAAPGLGGAIGRKSDWEMVGTKILPDAVPKSADFWVPLIAAVGGMLGARAPNLANAIGAGLTAGASAYMKREEFAQEALKNSLGMIEKRFLPIFGEGDLKWLDSMTNRKLTDQQYSSLISQFPGMPRISTTLAEGAAPTAPAGQSRPAGAAAPAEGASGLEPRTPPAVAPPKVEPPAPPPSGLAPAAPAPAGRAEERPTATPQQNLTSFEPPTFATQPEADAWVMSNAERLFSGVPAERDPRTYLRRAAGERQKEQLIEARIAAISGDPRPAAREQIAQLRAERTNAETERSKATDKANELIAAASALAMARSKIRMETSEAVEKERQLADVRASGALERVEPVPGGPSVFRTQKEILDEIKSRGSAPAANPGAGNPAPNAPPATQGPVAQQPAFIAKRLEAVTDNEMKMASQFKERQPVKQRFDNLIKIVEAYQTGAFAEFKQDAIRWARGLGFDIKETDTANPEAFQLFRKNAVSSVIEQAKGLSGPIAFKELDLIGKANVEATMEPGAVAALLAEGKGLLNYEDQFYKDYAAWRRNNRDNPYPDFDFNIGWVERNPTGRFIEDEKKNVAALGQRLPGRDPSAYTHGQKYIIRQGNAFGPAFWDAKRQGFSRTKPEPLGE